MLKDYCISTIDAASEEKFVGEFWDERWNEEADDLAARRRKILQHPYFPLLQSAIAERPRGRVLDCGCGMGEWTLQLAEEGVDVVGIDIAGKRIELLAQRFGDERFRRGSFLGTGFDVNSFDVAFNWGGAEHFEAGPQLAFVEAYRVLKPGGYFLASTPAHNLRHMLRGFRTPPPESCAADRRFYQYRFTKAEMHAELVVAGFRVDRIAFLDAHEGVRRWLSTWIPDGRIHSGLAAVLGRIAPGWLLGHMIVGIGRKPEAAAQR